MSCSHGQYLRAAPSLLYVQRRCRFLILPNSLTSHSDRVYILSSLLTCELLTLLTKPAPYRITALRGSDELLFLRLHRARHHSAITLLWINHPAYNLAPHSSQRPKSSLCRLHESIPPPTRSESRLTAHSACLSHTGGQLFYLGTLLPLRQSKSNLVTPAFRHIGSRSH